MNKKIKNEKKLIKRLINCQKKEILCLNFKYDLKKK